MFTIQIRVTEQLSRTYNLSELSVLLYRVVQIISSDYLIEQTTQMNIGIKRCYNAVHREISMKNPNLLESKEILVGLSFSQEA